jgi:hypothetical protein
VTEHVRVPGRRLGRRPPKNAPALRLGRYLTGLVPVHPATADHLARVPDWGLYANDRYSDCGPVSAANERKLITRYLTAAELSPSQADVFDLYRRSGNPGFDPADPSGPGDGGVDMQTMCEALAAGGIGGVKPLGFAKVDHLDLGELDAAVAIFGSLLLGVTLQQAQDAQTDSGLWDYAPSPTWGGHAVLAGRYQSGRLGVVTWGRTVEATARFLDRQLDEAWVVIWPEHVGDAAFLEGVHLADLAADYEALTGRPFPAAIGPDPAPPGPPGPAPRPVADDLDVALWGAVRHWAGRRHGSENKEAAAAVRKWAAGKGLA